MDHTDPENKNTTEWAIKVFDSGDAEEYCQWQNLFAEHSLKRAGGPRWMRIILCFKRYCKERQGNISIPDSSLWRHLHMERDGRSKKKNNFVRDLMHCQRICLFQPKVPGDVSVPTCATILL